MRRTSTTRASNRQRSNAQQWESDALYFDAHKREFLRKYRNKYVAIWHGKVVDADYDRVVLTERVYSAHGYNPNINILHSPTLDP